MPKSTSKKKPAFSPQDVRRIQFISDPMLHPEGQRIAFVLRRVDPDAEENRYQSEIQSIEANGRGRRSLSATGMDAEVPLWSPDGKDLLFLSKRKGDEHKQLYLMPNDGGEAQRLTEVDKGVTAACWSPDGRYIAFLSPTDPRPKPNGRRGEDKPFADDVELVDRALWQLNGLGSRLRKQAHLFLVARRGSRPVQLTDGPWSVGGPFLASPAFAFSPDSEKLYYLATPDPDDDWSASRQVDVFEIDLDGGGGKRRLTEFSGMFGGLAVAPDGGLYAIGNDLERRWASPNRLWRIDPKSGSYEAVAPDFEPSLTDAMNCDVRFTTKDRDPWISPDGTRARARATQGGALRLVEFDLTDGGHTWLTPEDQSILAWHSTPDGTRRVEIRSSMTEMPELWLVDEAAEARRITRLNDRLLSERKLYPARHLPFKASDGQQVDSWIIMPPGRPKTGRPLVLEIHGGPKTVYGQAFVLEFQMLAGEGYAVLFSNPRGSDGYGVDFAEAVLGRYGERDYQDLMEAVDHALKQDLPLNANRLGVLGGSYGGFMTNWIIGHTQRFKAAVSQRGISNWLSFFGTSDIGYFFTAEHVDALPWKDPQRYLEKSPLTYVENMNTPLLIIHSEKDLRCPIEQVEQLFVYLKRLGREVKLARFPEETHELSRSGSPNRRMERLRLIREWFREHL